MNTPQTARTPLLGEDGGVRAPQTGDGTTAAVPGPTADARPGADRANPRGPGGHPTVREHGTTSRYAAGCRCSDCRAAKARSSSHYRRRYQEAVGGPSSHPAPRRWALTEKGYAALGQVNVRIPTRDQLWLIAEQHREAR